MSKLDGRHVRDRMFKYWGMFSTFFGLFMLLVLIVSIVKVGAPRLSWEFISGFPSFRPEQAGILPAMVGTIWIMVLTAMIAIPIGIGAGIYLQEYGQKNRLANIVEINITNLAGVPSIIYGLLGLEVFGRVLGMGGNLMAGSLTLALLILPIIIVSTRETLKAVPGSLREASYALGASKWQTISNVIFPAAFGGMLTGIIIAVSRAVGEAAPLIVIGALAYVPFVPSSPASEFSVLPIQIFNWISRPQHGFAVNASAGIIVLLVITFLLNGIAVYLRLRSKNKQSPR